MTHTIRCPGCGECIRECSLQANAIERWEEGVRIHLDLCNRCGHCGAVCPNGCMDHPLAPMGPPAPQPPTPQQALEFLRTPRSVRRYRSQPVPRELMTQLLEAGRYPQTAKNTQGIRYLVLEGADKVQQVNLLYCQIARSLPPDFPNRDTILRPVLRQEQEGFDALFYGCPQLIFAVSAQDHPNWQRNAQFSLTFLSLMAPSLGLGTCWSGQLEKLACTREYMPDFARLIDLPDGMRICGCLMAGYPAVRFRRLVPRDPLEVFWR